MAVCQISSAHSGTDAFDDFLHDLCKTWPKHIFDGVVQSLESLKFLEHKDSGCILSRADNVPSWPSHQTKVGGSVDMAIRTWL
jgi:hypothetical protein